MEFSWDHFLVLVNFLKQSITNPSPIWDGPFRSRSRMGYGGGGCGKRPTLIEICHTYPEMI